MALKLGLCFSGFAFPVAIAVLNLFVLAAGLGEPGAWFRTPFDGARFAAVGTFWH